MAAQHATFRPDEAALIAELEITIVQHYAELGLISPAAGYGEADLAELRRVRRLMRDLELDHPAIEIVLRMRRRMLALQAEVRRLEDELRRAARRYSMLDIVDADWDDVL